MKVKLIIVFLVFCLAVSFTTYVYAENALTKLGRGIVNTATGWLEVPKRIYNTAKDENVMVGITVGTAKGIGWGVTRTAVGIYEVVTFPFPIPTGYKQIIDPEYVFTSETE
ncbi:MAG: exosortase system-associated protein, TIGR04073 family [Candidatus Omnitrophota bacterium]